MRDYCDGNRGTFQRIECAKQLVSFDGMKYRGRDGTYNVTPTDIDGCIQLDKENCIIFFELKYAGEIPSGQQAALERICDAVQKSGTNCIIIQAEHGAKLPEPIIAKYAIVKQVYYDGKWRRIPTKRLLGEMIENYIRYVGCTKEQRYERYEQIPKVHNA